jgi:predicted CXXCH cytochrome family protein
VKASHTLAMLVALLVAACAGVLGLRPRNASHPFEHRAHVLHGVNCVECHANVGTSGAAAPIHLPTEATCRGCHAKPHDDHACLDCHGEASAREEADIARQHLRFAHKNHQAPVRGDCVRCHEAVAEEHPDMLRPKMATCFECHEHREQWTTRDCDGCHRDLAAEDTPPQSHLVHDGDWLREHGTRAAGARDLCASCHSERSCAACHGVGTVPALPATLAFDEVPLSGLHRAGFLARHSDEARADPGLCTTCHTQSSCQGCHDREHVSPSTASRSPHPLGWISPGAGGGDHGVQARIDPTSCAGCHGGAGEQLCVGCHHVGGPGGNPHGAGFRSARNKFHDLPCRLCHGVGP